MVRLKLSSVVGMAIPLVKAGFQSGTGCHLRRRRRLRESLNSLLGASRETNSEPFQFFCIIPSVDGGDVLKVEGQFVPAARPVEHLWVD